MNRELCISVEAEIDSEIYKSLLKYLDRHPYWDLNRVLTYVTNKTTKYVG